MFENWTLFHCNSRQGTLSYSATKSPNFNIIFKQSMITSLVNQVIFSRVSVGKWLVLSVNVKKRGTWVT